MKLVSMLIAAFSFLFSASVFSMETPIYGFVDSPHAVQSFVIGNLAMPEADRQMETLIDNSKSLEYADANRWRYNDSQSLTVSETGPARLTYEVGWQVQEKVI